MHLLAGQALGCRTSRGAATLDAKRTVEVASDRLRPRWGRLARDGAASQAKCRAQTRRLRHSHAVLVVGDESFCDAVGPLAARAGRTVFGRLDINQGRQGRPNGWDELVLDAELFERFRLSHSDLLDRAGRMWLVSSPAASAIGRSEADTECGFVAIGTCSFSDRGLPAAELAKTMAAAEPVFRTRRAAMKRASYRRAAEFQDSEPTFTDRVFSR